MPSSLAKAGRTDSTGSRRESELIDDLEAIAEVEADWRELAVSTGNAFITPEWFRAWFRHYGAGFEPFIVVSRRADGSIEGVLPLVVDPGHRVRHLRFAGANLGDNFQPAAHAEDEESVARTAGRFLCDRFQGHYVLTLDRIEEEAAWPAQLIECEQRKLAATPIGKGDVMPFLAVRGMSWGDYQASVSSHSRRTLRSKRTALERNHEFRYRKTTTVGEIDRDVDTLFELHDKRWNARGGSTLCSEVARAFLKDFAAEALRQNWLRLIFLEIEGEPVAAEFAWRLGDSYSCYQAGFDPGWQHRSVGYLLRMQSLEDAIGEGVDVFDLLLGGESHKSRLAPEQRTVQTTVVVPARHPVRLLVMSDNGLRRIARHLPEGTKRRLKTVNRRLLDCLPTSRQR